MKANPVLFVVCAVLFSPTLGNADQVNVQGVGTFTGNNTCSPPPCSETLNFSFAFDTATNTVVGGTMGITASGVDSGPWNYKGMFPYSNSPLFPFWFEWTGYGGSEDLRWFPGLGSTGFPAVGVYSNPYYVAGGGGTVADPMYVTRVAGNGAGMVTVTGASVPEPDSLVLLSTGILCGFAAVRRRLLG